MATLVALIVELANEMGVGHFLQQALANRKWWQHV